MEASELFLTSWGEKASLMTPAKKAPDSIVNVVVHYSTGARMR
jgi:hypothetical protein